MIDWYDIFLKIKIFILYDNKIMELFYWNFLIMFIMFLCILYKFLEVDCYLIVYVNCFVWICIISFFIFVISYWIFKFVFFISIFFSVIVCFIIVLNNV